MHTSAKRVLMTGVAAIFTAISAMAVPITFAQFTQATSNQDWTLTNSGTTSTISAAGQTFFIYQISGHHSWPATRRFHVICNVGPARKLWCKLWCRGLICSARVHRDLLNSQILLWALIYYLESSMLTPQAPQRQALKSVRRSEGRR